MRFKIPFHQSVWNYQEETVMSNIEPAGSASNAQTNPSPPGGKSQPTEVRTTLDAQQALNRHAGETVAPESGELSSQTVMALQQFQKKNGLAQTGKLDAPTARALSGAASVKETASEGDDRAPLKASAGEKHGRLVELSIRQNRFHRILAQGEPSDSRIDGFKKSTARKTGEDLAVKAQKKIEKYIGKTLEVRSKKLEMSAEAEAAHDIANGLDIYKKNIDKVKTYVEKYGELPGKKTLEKIAGELNKVSKTLGKASKIAGAYRDAKNLGDSIKEFSSAVRDIDPRKDPASVVKFTNAAQELHSSAKPYLEAIKNRLRKVAGGGGELAQGAARATLVIGYVETMVVGSLKMGGRAAEIGGAIRRNKEEQIDAAAEAREVRSNMANGRDGDGTVQEPRRREEIVPARFESIASMRARAKKDDRARILGQAEAAARRKFEAEAFPQAYRKNRQKLYSKLKSSMSQRGSSNLTGEVARTGKLERFMAAMDSSRYADSEGGRKLTSTELRKEMMEFEALGNRQYQDLFRGEMEKYLMAERTKLEPVLDDMGL